MGKIEKLKNIEILRFIFILIIVCCHLDDNAVLDIFANQIPMYQKFMNHLKWAHIPVDFFFIISGFFLFLTTDFTQKFIDFAKKKLIRLIPLVLYALGLFFVFTQFTPLIWSPHENIFTILCLQNLGLTFNNGSIGASWFISVLFWVMCFYFYFYKICDKRWFNLITAIIILTCYSLYLHSGLPHFKNVGYVFNVGLARGLAGIGMGYFILMYYKENENFRNKNLSILSKLLITGLEIYLLGFIIYYSCLARTGYNNFLILIVYFIILFWLFLVKKGYLSQLFNNNFSVFLGQFTFAIFLTHQLIIKLWHFYICVDHPNWVIAHPVINLILLFTAIIGFGIFTYYVFEKPVTKYLKNF